MNSLPYLTLIAILAWLGYHLTTWLAKTNLGLIDAALQTGGLK